MAGYRLFHVVSGSLWVVPDGFIWFQVFQVVSGAFRSFFGLLSTGGNTKKCALHVKR